uniref:Uncharacterized protein n=1 Tax=Arundo donax TaxID=35708 RepID=A0A0A8XTN1_ARUDO
MGKRCEMPVCTAHGWCGGWGVVTRSWNPLHVIGDLPEMVLDSPGFGFDGSWEANMELGIELWHCCCSWFYCFIISRWVLFSYSVQ